MFPFDKAHNELVFENKNKMYGAYVIRREYDYALKISVLVATGFLGLIVTAGIIANNKHTTVKKVITEELPGLVITIDPPIDKPTEDPHKPKIEKHVVTPTRPPSGDPVVTNEKLNEKEQKQLTTPADPNLPVGDTDSVPKSGENTTVFTVSKPVEKEKAILVASEMPDIEGGVLAFVKNNIRYPEDAKENNAQGTVFLSFVVERDGSISNIEVLNKQKVGYGCEEEAIRVIKSGKWKPGKNMGQAVRVQFTLPVKYQLK